MAWGGPPQSAFATFLILCSTSFSLGILFSLFPYDYPILWTPANDRTADAFAHHEQHLKILHASPLLIPRILHTVIGTGLLGFFMKLYRPSESNMLFDGASLILYMIGVAIYIANIVKGMRSITSGTYDQELVQGEIAVGRSNLQPGDPEVPLGRDESLRVLAASNTILALVLVGVLVLQAGQWYAERKVTQELEEAEQERKDGGAKSDSTARLRSPAGKKKTG